MHPLVRLCPFMPVQLSVLPAPRFAVRAWTVANLCFRRVIYTVAGDDVQFLNRAMRVCFWYLDLLLLCTFPTSLSLDASDVLITVCTAMSYPVLTICSASAPPTGSRTAQYFEPSLP